MIDFEKERESFEAWQDSIGSNIAKRGLEYVSDRTASEWFSWRNRAALAQEEITELKQKLEKLESGKFTLIENKKLTTWYLDEPEGMYWDFDGIDGAFSNLDGGQVIKVERLRNFTVPEVYVTRTWEDGDVGYWKEYATKEEAEKVAKHCKAMIEAVEKEHE